jgi:hypothetical protein
MRHPNSSGRPGVATPCAPTDSVSAPYHVTPTRHLVKAHLRLAASIFVAATALSSSAQAQLPVSASVDGPTIAIARAGVHAPQLGSEVPTALQATQRVTRSETLMIVGGALFLAGAIIGDDAGTIIMIGGAGIGIYGLYLYLQ